MARPPETQAKVCSIPREIGCLVTLFVLALSKSPLRCLEQANALGVARRVAGVFLGDRLGFCLGTGLRDGFLGPRLAAAAACSARLAAARACAASARPQNDLETAVLTKPR